MKYKIVPYIENFKHCTDNSLCDKALEKMYKHANNDPLGDNYSPQNLKLHEMIHYTFIFDENNEPEHAAGCQLLSENVVRVFSRYYVYPRYRYSGKHLLDKNDNFLDLKYWLPMLKQYKLIIWSREKGNGFFKRLKKHNYLFDNWNVYPKMIELRSKNNWQSIFYHGDINYIKEVIR